MLKPSTQSCNSGVGHPRFTDPPAEYKSQTISVLIARAVFLTAKLAVRRR
jgi:hypothetical protein